MDSIGKTRSDENSLVQKDVSGKAGAGSGESDQDSPVPGLMVSARLN